MLELFEHLAGEIAHGLNKFAQNAVIDSERQQREAAQLNLSMPCGGNPMRWQKQWKIVTLILQVIRTECL
jgi:hypothetical protein